jgi:hypothetical protein
MTEMTVPLVDRGNGLWGSPSPAWDHLINRESSGIPDIIQQIHDVNSGGNEAEGLFQITPKTWQRHNGTDFAPSARRATPQQQAIVAARIFTRNPSGSDWGAGRPGREDPRELAAGLVPLDDGVSNGGNNMGVSGDPVWLEDVLRPVLGDRLRTIPGWKTDGVGGSMGNIWGVVWHHTGNAAESAQSISQGRPDLSGPLAQLHIAPDGIVTIVAVGPCNHAGKGSWEGLPTDGANQRTIGIECAWPRDTSLTEATMAREPWPEAQMRSMIDVGYALAKKIGNGADHNITHAQWARFGPAGYRQYKWDPGNFDIWWFRGEIAKRLAADATPPIPTAPPVPPPPAVVPDKAGGSADDQLTYRWNQLGGQTVVEALAQVRDKVCGTQDAGKPGVKTL